MIRRTAGLGQAVAELALVLPIFLIMLMVLFDFGRVIYAHNAITQNARAATRLGAVSAPQTAAEITQRNAEILLRAKLVSPGVDYPNSAITGPGTGPMGPFYPEPTDPTDPPEVVVQIEVDVPILTPIISTLMGGEFTVTSTSEEQIKS